METKKPLSRNLQTAEGKARYDAAVKKLLADKSILAWILKSCTMEFKDVEIDEIIRTGISGEPQIAEAAVMPDEADIPPRMPGIGVEDVTITEGTVTFDIRFEALAPGNRKPISLIINVEAQNNFYPGYPLIKRGIYYGSRLISSQYGMVFTRSHYEKIKKVYSIWICPRPPKGRENTITEYSMTEKNRVGNVSEPIEHYDLITVIMLCLGDTKRGNSAGILELLGVLLSSAVEAAEKQRILEQDFGFAMTEQLESEVADMCNLSEGVWEDGMKEGIKEGIEKGIASSIESLMQKMKMTAEQAMDALSIPEEEQPRYKAMLKR